MLAPMGRLAPLRGYAAALAAVALVSAVIGVIEARAQVANISMLYLLAVLGAATRLGRGPAIAASIAAFLAFNWFFVEPTHTLSVGDPKEWFAKMDTLPTLTATTTYPLEPTPFPHSAPPELPGSSTFSPGYSG